MSFMDNIYLMYEKIYFAQWLRDEIRVRRMSQAELARRANLSPAAVSKTLNQKSFPGWEACLAYAKALGLPPETVLRAAGLLPEERDDHGRVEDEIMDYKYRELSVEDKGKVLQFIEFLQDQKDKEHQREFIERHTREGEAPPETVKKK
jgi:transcriptional regulator with XRE-family HTH domain